MADGGRRIVGSVSHITDDRYLTISRCYMDLVVAIIERAIKDNAPRSWFNSDWYALLTTDIPELQDGDGLWLGGQENRANGYYAGLRPITDEEHLIKNRENKRRKRHGGSAT